jgi:hypothetical protein
MNEVYEIQMAFAWLPFIALAATAIGGVTQAIGQIQQGRWQRQIAEQNAKREEAEAMARQQEAMAKAKAQRGENERRIERMRSKYLKGGVAMEGTPLEVLAESAGDLELQALEIERYGEVASKRHLQQAGIDRMGGEAAWTGAKWGAGATLLSTAGDMAGMQYGFKRKTGTAKPGT